MKIPAIRFPEFSGEWKEVRLKEITSKKSSNISLNTLENNNGKYKIYGATGLLKYIDFFTENEDYISIVKDGAGVGRVLLCKKNSSVLGTLDIIKAKKEINLYFIFLLLGKINFRIYITGSTIPHIYYKDYSKIRLHIPPTIAEQEKIANFLSAVDEKIEIITKKIENLKLYKKGLLQKMLNVTDKGEPEVRFKEFSGKWVEKKLGDVLDYLQPTKYLVKNTEYKDIGIPVLTAGKSFILGYTDEKFGIYNEKLPIILFDDFTTNSKFVDFSFKVKSSAIKILLSKNGNNIKFIFEQMQNLKFKVGGHQRHWLSVFSKLKIPIPPTLEEQEKIANFLTSIDEKIEIEENKLKAVKEYKKGLLQKMFV